MTLETLVKLRNNQYYINYIRENSYWYKLLNRNPLLFKTFEEEVKKNYGLRTTDKISKALDTFNLISTLFSNQ